MRIFRIIAIVLTASIIGIVIHSCCEGYAYKWAYIITKNLDINQKSDDLFIERDSVRVTDYGIRVHFFEQKLISHIPKLFNELYATSCREAYPVEDSITEIHIITLNPFNETSGSGEDVSEYFMEYYYNYSIEESVKRINVDDWSVIEYLDFVAIDSSVFESVHQFIVNVHLSDNRIMSDTTEPVNLIR